MNWHTSFRILSFGATILLSVAACGESNPRQEELAVAEPSPDCLALMKTEIDGVTIDQAKIVEAEGDMPAYCEIGGVIAPEIGFVSRLPLDTWNGKYFQSGCGGFCGAVLPDKPTYSNSIIPAVKAGYAATTTDAGHSGNPHTAAWAQDDPQAEDIFAQTSIPLVFHASHRILDTFYARSANVDYFSGCSNGGRMGAIAAQRYPDLFDGILSGGPVLNMSHAASVYGSWLYQKNRDDTGQVILDHRFNQKLPALHAAVLAQCDGLDGQVDGLIEDPRLCVIDKKLLPACTSGEDGTDCFQPQEIEVVDAWYRGPHNSAGDRLYEGVPPGSEKFWPVWLTGSEARLGGAMLLSGGYLSHVAFEKDPADGFDPADFDFDGDFSELETQGKLINALDPNLNAFRDAGGRLIMWHGWADALVLPQPTIDYYEAVLAEMGGLEAVQPFYRLFMVAGKGHCWELPGDGPDQFNPIAALEAWVEGGQAPQEILAEQYGPDGRAVRSARLRPYPEKAKLSTSP